MATITGSNHPVKRRAILTKVKEEAKHQGKSFQTIELTNHTGANVGTTRSTLKRHSEIDEVTMRKFFEQFTSKLGKGWWR